jgi:hypothetical protein
VMSREAATDTSHYRMALVLFAPANRLRLSAKGVADFDAR